MANDLESVSGEPGVQSAREAWVHRWITIVLQTLLVIGFGFALWERQWLAGATTVAILFITLLPTLLGRRFSLHIPAEFEALTVVFVFASLFLGEVRGYYLRFWWWDIVLHVSSGFLLGILGFLLVYVLNEREDLSLDLNPGFVAFFAFLFALGLGTVWEIFEFGMDQIFGLRMQKGLVDTMWDLIVDAAGAFVIAILGYGYLQTTEVDSFLEEWIVRFIDGNPRLFRK